MTLDDNVRKLLKDRPAAVSRETIQCVVCDERVPMSHGTPGWIQRHSHDGVRDIMADLLGRAESGESPDALNAAAQKMKSLWVSANRLDAIVGRINAADDGDAPPSLREVYLIASGHFDD